MEQKPHFEMTTNLFNKVVEAAPNAMIMINAKGQITMVNLQTEKLFGYARGELLGALVENLVPAKVRMGHAALRENFLKAPQTRAMGAGRELYGLRRDGTEVPIEIGLNPLEIDGETFVLASIIDITERKKNEQLIAAREAALEASRIKSQFLATMSHEIRTPLNGIIGLTNLLFNMDMSEAQKEHLQGIRVSADTLLGLINDILDLSKIEADKMDVETINFHLGQMLTDAISIINSSAKQKGLEVKVEVDPSIPPWIKGDMTKLKQVMINLLGNAIKFTDAGKILVRAKRLKNEPEITVMFEVEDTGIGIGEDVRKKLFEVFTQGDDSTRRKYGGTGLGLSISKKLVEKMGGQIGVESLLGEGSRFWFHLQLEEGQEVIIEKNHSRMAMNAQLKDFRILVAEDNSINQKVALGFLENLGIQGQAVANGAEAVELLKKFKFDLVLMDCHMPEMDGYEATQRIRQLENPRLRKIPIVAMTANVMQGDRERCLAIGMNDYISKPIVFEELEKSLLKWLPLKEESPKKEESEINSKDFDVMKEALVKLMKSYRKGFAQDVVHTFIMTTPNSLQKIEQSFQNQDYKTLMFESHSLKSSSLILGLRHFSSLSARIEGGCRKEEYNEMPELISQLRTEHERILADLKEELTKLPI